MRLLTHSADWALIFRSQLCSQPGLSAGPPLGFELSESGARGDVGIEYVRLDLGLDSEANGDTSTSPYWLQYTMTIDPALSVTGDALVIVTGFDENGAEVFRTWSGRYEGNGRFKYRLWYGPENEDNTGSPSLGLISATDEWRVLIRIDPTAQTQTHWVFRNGQPQHHPILGAEFSVIASTVADFLTLRLQTLGYQIPTGDVDCSIDEIRLTANPPPGELRAVPAGLGQVRLTWSDLTSDEDGFVVERRTAMSDWQSVAASLPPRFDRVHG